ncbi:MFS superfamily sulfate permease-like transporter [Cryobacterium sp. MP_M3]|nr:MFS superfamily sulfate permease-like transporter [Cryobacterium sp. MP_M3]
MSAQGSTDTPGSIDLDRNPRAQRGLVIDDEGLAILIFIAQLPHLLGVPWLVYPLVAVGLVIMVVMPRITKIIPAPLVAIVLLTVATVVTAVNVPNVGDQGALPKSLPELFIPNVPLTWETFSIIAPYAIAMALVGLLESLMTAKLVDDITDTHSRKTREAWGRAWPTCCPGSSAAWAAAP